jgi:DNA-binding GntR family transcriptional regulator
MELEERANMSSLRTERLRTLITEDILSLKLQPGDRLEETGLAQKYGTSRTPVREALRQLSADGLVEIRPKKGAIVAKFSIRELAEHFEVMAELEGACGRLAAKSYTVQDLDAIGAAQEACRKYSEQRDTQSYQLADEAFHAAIHAASRNDSLVKLIRGIGKRVAVYRRSQFEQVDWIRLSISEHDLIVQAIQEGLTEEADRLLQLHTMNLGGDFLRMLRVVMDGEAFVTS